MILERSLLAHRVQVCYIECCISVRHLRPDRTAPVQTREVPSRQAGYPQLCRRQDPKPARSNRSSCRGTVGVFCAPRDQYFINFDDCCDFIGEKGEFERRFAKESAQSNPFDIAHHLEFPRELGPDRWLKALEVLLLQRQRRGLCPFQNSRQH